MKNKRFKASGIVRLRADLAKDLRRLADRLEEPKTDERTLDATAVREALEKIERGVDGLPMHLRMLLHRVKAYEAEYPNDPLGAGVPR